MGECDKELKISYETLNPDAILIRLVLFSLHLSICNGRTLLFILIWN